MQLVHVITRPTYHKPTYHDFFSKYYSYRAKSDPSKTNYDFTSKIESVQFNAALAITGCVQSRERSKKNSTLNWAYHRFMIEGVVTDFPSFIRF